MKHKIEISYQTGDSFRSEDTTDILELGWDDLEVAKENLQAIKEHHAMVEDIQDRWDNKKSKEQHYEENKDKFWFVKEYPHSDKDYYIQHCMNLKTDDGTLMQISCYWMGYFERLYGAEIITDESDMKFTV